MRVKNLLEKDVYITLSSTSESRKFNVSEDTQPKRPRWVYCTLFIIIDSIYLGVGYLELLILRQGNARARMWDKRSRAPTSFHLALLLTADSGVL